MALTIFSAQACATYETSIRSGSTKTSREVIAPKITRDSYEFDISRNVVYGGTTITDITLTLKENMRGPMEDVKTWEWRCVQTEWNPGLPLLGVAGAALTPAFMLIEAMEGGKSIIGDMWDTIFSGHQQGASTQGPWIIGKDTTQDVPATTGGCKLGDPRHVTPTDEIWRTTRPASGEKILIEVSAKPEGILDASAVAKELSTNASGEAKFSMVELYKAMKGPPSEVRILFKPANAPELAKLRVDDGSSPTTLYGVVQEIKFQERERSFEKTHEESLKELLSLKQTYEKELKRGEFEGRVAYNDRIAEVRRQNLANIDNLSQNLRSTVRLGTYDPDAFIFPLEFSSDLSPIAKNRKYVAKVPLQVAKQVKEDQSEFRFRPFVDSNSALEVAIAGGVIENRRTGESYEVSWYAEGGKLPQRMASMKLGSGTPQGVAIYPFRASGGAEEAFAEAITSLFGTSLSGQSKCVRIVGEDVIEDLAKQMALEQQCGTESCQIDLASAAKAEFMIRGDLTKLNKKYYLTATLIDLATKETLGSNKVESSEAQIAEKADQLASAISGTIGCK
ncbi:MAG: hypothetical protein KDH09_14465 [Chrysiogenetes bacterium]|nr:hypothetical protein [Chrysiogenetes bacterium]